MSVPVEIGSVFGRLTVVGEGERVPNGAKSARGIIVQCSCGSPSYTVNINNLRSGRAISCGCARRESAAKTAEGQRGKTREEIKDGVQAGLEGREFGRLTVVEDLGNIEEYRAYRCTCSCGQEVVVAAYRLIHEKGPRSCGCLQRDVVTTHGMEGTRVYNIWHGMKARCSLPTNISYHQYGGRGITYCERWEIFENFIANMGEPPSEEHSLDRINNDGNYSPENCRWATIEVQSNNRSNSRFLEFQGRRQTLTQWAKELGMSPATIRGRLERDWTVEEALTTVPDLLFRSKSK